MLHNRRDLFTDTLLIDRDEEKMRRERSSTLDKIRTKILLIEQHPLYHCKTATTAFNFIILG